VLQLELLVLLAEQAHLHQLALHLCFHVQHGGLGTQPAALEPAAAAAAAAAVQRL
jgi:hypothetical protein